MTEENYELKWHWALERVSTNSYCVYDTDSGETLSQESTPQLAIQNAHEKPLTPTQQKYTPSFAHNFLCDLENALREYDDNFDFHPRAAKLMVKRKPFIVVAHDEPYFKEVYTMIKLEELLKGTWTKEDEKKYQNYVSSI